MRFVSLLPGREAASRSPASAAPTASASRSRRVRSSRASWRLQRALGDLEHGHRGHLGLVDVRVDADDPALAGVELALVAVRGVGDLALRIALGDGRDHPAAPVDLVDVAPRPALDLGRQRLHEPRAAERVDGGVDAGLLGDDLLLPEGEQGGLGGRDRERLVVGVGVERLGPAQDRGERLDRDAGQVVRAAAAASARRRRSACGSASRPIARSRRRSARS